MRLVACPTCHTQYDVSRVLARSFGCRCGSEVENRELKASDVPSQRCGSCGALLGDGSRRCEYCGAACEIDPSRLSLICPECYARNADASRFCTACGVAFRPEPISVEGRELPCPACEVLMPPRPLMGLALNECAKCCGLWVPADCFEQLVERARENRSRAEPSATPALRPRSQGANPARQRVLYRSCPICDAQMQRRNFRKSSGVIVDRCRDHGTWLDADELEQIAGFLLGGGETHPLLRSPPPAAEAAPEPRAAAGLARIAIGRDRPREGLNLGSAFELLEWMLR